MIKNKNKNKNNKGNSLNNKVSLQTPVFFFF